MNYERNMELIARADDIRLRCPEKPDNRRIETERDLERYINANDFTEDVIEDLQEMFYDQGFVEVDE